MTFEMHCMST